MRTTIPGRLAALLAGPAVLTAATLTACGAEEHQPSAERTAADGSVFNDSDSDFASELLQQRAEEMLLVDLTVGRRLSPELTAFVDTARMERSDDIEAVTTWLTDWGEPIPETVRDHAAAHGDGSGHHELEAAEGAAFEAAWIDDFLAEIDDIEGLVSEEQEVGANADAVELAEQAEARYDDEADALEDLAG